MGPRKHLRDWLRKPKPDKFGQIKTGLERSIQQICEQERRSINTTEKVNKNISQKMHKFFRENAFM